jgi:hypothetical protein
MGKKPNTDKQTRIIFPNLEEYLQHLTIKWKDLLKKETAIVHVMGIVNKPTQVPLTLLILGEHGKVLASKTEYAKFTGASASYEFNVKSVMSGIDEKDVYFISAKIEMYDQEIHIIVDKNKLILPTYCLELFIAQSYPEDVEIFPNDKKTCGKWGGLTQTPTQPQNAEAIQDQLNFGTEKGKPFIVDPPKFGLEEGIDIGKQSLSSLNFIGKSKEGIKYVGGVREAYNKALNTRGVLIDFEWKQTNPDADNFGKVKPIGFNSNQEALIKTKAWPFGRISAKLVAGKIMACKNGWYYIEGKLVFEKDYYSWVPDGKGFKHNQAISLLGRNHNAPSQGNWEHGSLVSQYVLGDTEPSMGDVTFDLDLEDNEVFWNKASNAYDNTDKDKHGQMPMQYAREFYFYTYGKI